MDEIEDVYTDGFMLGGSPFGLTLTFTLTEPPMTPGPQEIASNPVVRVRMSRELGKTLIEHLNNALTAATPVQASGVKH